jgi:outer membrane protein assembly factor BamB
MITSVSPSRVKAGDVVVVAGRRFTRVTKVSIDDVSAHFNVISATKIEATVPATATSGAVRVTAGALTATSPEKLSVDSAINSFRPTSGGVGRTVTINGTGFTSPCSIKFNTTAARTCTVVSAAKITAAVPPMAATGTISVTIGGVTETTASSFTVTLGLALSANSGAPSTLVTVYGTGYDSNELVDLYVGETDEALVATNAKGDFSYPGFSIPASTQPGTAWISAAGRRSGVAAQEPFTVRTNWYQFGFGPAHSGTNPYENTLDTANVANLGRQWRYTTSDSVTSSPAVVNGVVYVGSYDTYVYAINAATGAKLWRYKTGAAIVSSPAVANGVVYIDSTDGYFYALKATTGTELWRYAIEESVSSPTVVNGVVYVGSVNGLYAIDAANGTKRWSFATSDEFESSPAVANGVVYVGSDDDDLYALDASTGAELWHFVTDGGVSSSPTVYDNFLYVGSDDERLYCLDATNGTELWNFSTTPNDGSGVVSSPTAVNGVVYVGYPGEGVFALNAFGGGVIWGDTIDALGGDVFGEPTVVNGVVYVGSTDHNFYALNASTGARLWVYKTGGDVNSSAAVVNGMVYVGSYDHNLYAFSLPPELAGAAAHDPNTTSLRPDLTLKVSK